jgi:hypothetical protein
MSADDAKLAALRAQLHAELAKSPKARPWWAGAGVMLTLNAVTTFAAVSMIGSDADPARDPILRWGVAALILAVITLGTVVGLRPGPRWPQMASLVATALTVALAVTVGAVGPMQVPLWAGTSCATTECLVALVPLTTGLILLSGFAFDPLRTAVVGLSSGAVGVLALYVHCPVGTWSHQLMFHASPWVALFAVLWLVRRAMPSKTFAP